MHPSQVVGKQGLGIVTGDLVKKIDNTQIRPFVETKLPNGATSTAIYLGSWTVAESKKIKVKIEKNNYVIPCNVILRPNGNSNYHLYLEFESIKPFNREVAIATALAKVTDSIL